MAGCHHLQKPTELTRPQKPSAFRNAHDALAPVGIDTRPRIRSGALLQAEQHQNLSRPFLEWLERFANQSAGTVKLDAPDIHRLGLHPPPPPFPLPLHTPPLNPAFAPLTPTPH